MNTRPHLNFRTRTRKKCTRTSGDQSADAQKIAFGGKYQKDQNHDFGAFQYFLKKSCKNLLTKYYSLSIIKEKL